MGCETHRTVGSTGSYVQLNNHNLQTIVSTQCDTVHGPTSHNGASNLSQIKTDLKDKILSTRERFHQLKQRKRQSNASNDPEAAQVSNGQPNFESTIQPNELGFAIGQGTVRGFYQTYRSNSNRRGQQDQQLTKRDQKREISNESDNLDPDEETHGEESNLTKRRFSKQQVKKVLKNSLYRSLHGLPSYKLDGAKLILNRLQIQLKKRFDDLFEVRFRLSHFQGVMNLENFTISNQASSSNLQNQQILQDKWKFVRNVMSNMERTKKQPLQDKTNYQHQKKKQTSSSSSNKDSFVQIQQMFENFKSMRASGGEGTIQSMKTKENFNPNMTQSPAQGALKKINSKSKEQTTRRLGKRVDLPPQYNVIKLQDKPVNPQSKFLKTDKFLFNSGGTFDCDSFTSTFRENEYFMNLQKQDTITSQGVNGFQNMLTSRSNIMLEDELPEGLSQLPMESPMNTDKFIARRQYLKQESQKQRQQASLERLVAIKENQIKKQGFDVMKSKQQAHDMLKRLLRRKVQEEKIHRNLKIKGAFVKLIKNCIFKNKVEEFFQRSSQRLLEKAFDRIKENNWAIEERKEILEAILVKQKVKQAFIQMKQRNKKSQKVQKMLNHLEHASNTSQMLRALKQWYQLISSQKQNDEKIVKLIALIDHYKYKKQGFTQMKRQAQLMKMKAKSLVKLINTSHKLKLNQSFAKWKQDCMANQTQNSRYQLMHNILYNMLSFKLKNAFTEWKAHAQQYHAKRQIEINKALISVIKPRLRTKEAQFLRQTFHIMHKRVIKYERVKKQLKILMMTVKQQQRSQLYHYFNKWHTINHSSKIVKMSYIDQSIDEEPQVQEDNDQLLNNGNIIDISTSNHLDNELAHLTFAPTRQHEDQSFNNEIESEIPDNADDKENEDFENLIQIRRISFESSGLNKMVKNNGSKDEMAEALESLPQLQLNKRGISEIIRKPSKNGSGIQNLRYL